jgi:hypothetical protein
VLVAVRGQGDQRFELADRIEPGSDRAAVVASPALCGKRGVHAVEQRQVEDLDDGIAA